MGKIRIAAAFVMVLLSFGCQSASLVLYNGTIVTVDDRIGTVSALAVRGGRIVAVGSDRKINAYIGKNTQVIDLQGRFAMPGFIEGHAHFTSLGEMKMKLDLMTVNNWDEVIALVKEAVSQAPPGQWIFGRGWHQEKWDKLPADSVEGFPTHHALSAISPNHPVCLTHASGHACFFNAYAMELAGVDAETPNPAGGEILHDGAGQPIGIFTETASGLVSKVYRQQADRSPTAVQDRLRRAIRLADLECLENGITSFQDAGSSFKTIKVIRQMAEAGEIGTRLWVMIRDSNERLRQRLPDFKMIGAANHHLTVRAIKRTIDGALGSRGAWMLKPYTDSPQSAGLNTASLENVSQTARIARDHNMQLCVHAIGDRANREVLNLFENTFDSRSKLRDARWRVEHAQHLHPDDIPRFAALGVIASMQGVHCTSDGPWVFARLGAKRAKDGAYVWQKLMQSGAVVTNGTDAPVEDVSPIAGFYATVSRKVADGSRFFPDQRMSRLEALKSYTINGAYAAFEEDIKGTLTPGKLADIVVLSHNILTCPEADIPDTKVIYTIVGGQIKYQTN